MHLQREGKHADWPKEHGHRVLRPSCVRLGLRPIGWHVLRHTHATWLSESGATIRAAQDILGQSDMETTLRVYTHSVPDSKRRAVANVAALLFPSVPPQGRPLRGSRSYVVEKKEETGNFGEPGRTLGEPGRTRTCNPLIKSQLLYH